MNIKQIRELAQIVSENGLSAIEIAEGENRVRIERAVKSGFSEEDVRARIARQITDADRIEASDVVFNNDGTPDELRNEVISWWNEYKKTI